MLKIGVVHTPYKNCKIIDITVKNNRGHVLAPTWDLVMGLKNKDISWKEYERGYINLLKERYKVRKDEFMYIAELAKRENVVLVCFCKDENFCHRSLAKVFIENLMEGI